MHIGHNAGRGSSGSDAKELGGELRDERPESSSSSKSSDRGSLNEEMAKEESGLESIGGVVEIFDPDEDCANLGDEGLSFLVADMPPSVVLLPVLSVFSFLESL